MTDERLSAELPRTGPTTRSVTSGDRLLAGRYRVERLIGRGGMAEVYRGTDTRLGRTVAIKLLKPSLAADPTFRIRFRQEAQAAARMTHPTIVRVFDAGEESVIDHGVPGQLPYIVMEHVDGRLLKDRIAEGPIDVAEAAHIVSGILTALEYSHRAGVVHRDIKPGNIMVTAAGQVKVMDFGIARAISDSSATVAQTSAILGTAQYFSPEQAKGATVDARSDLYSTGIVLFEMLTGRPPFTGESPVAVAYQHVSEPPPTPSAINLRVPRAFDAVTHMALAKDAADRYQSAAEFRGDVAAALAGRPTIAGNAPVAAPPTELLFSGPVTPEQTVRRLAVTDPAVQSSPRPPVGWIWAGIITVVVVVIAVLVWIVGLNTGGFGADQRTVPSNLAGLSAAQAERAIKDADLVPEVHEEASRTVEQGDVIRSSPSGGVTVTEKSVVRVWVSTGMPRTAVPTLAGLSESAAKRALEAQHLDWGFTTTTHSPTVPNDTVISSDPGPGESITEGTSVNLVVSDGQVDLPNLVGVSLTKAKQQLSALGLSLFATAQTDCGSESKGTVLSQEQAAGAVDQGSSVTLSYCGGP